VAASPPRLTGERDNVHFQLSPLTMIGIVAAVISTIAIIIAAVAASHQGGPPPGPGAIPPPPPSMTPLLIAVGFFAVSWVTVAVAVARDQIVVRMTGMNHTLEEIRSQSAELAKIEGRLTTLFEEYGERRETDGYLTAMREAENASRPNGEVRPLGTFRPRTR
jgi:hypothetical protein